MPDEQTQSIEGLLYHQLAQQICRYRVDGYQGESDSWKDYTGDKKNAIRQALLDAEKEGGPNFDLMKDKAWTAACAIEPQLQGAVTGMDKEKSTYYAIEKIKGLVDDKPLWEERILLRNPSSSAPSRDPPPSSQLTSKHSWWSLPRLKSASKSIWTSGTSFARPSTKDERSYCCETDAETTRNWGL